MAFSPTFLKACGLFGQTCRSRWLIFRAATMYEFYLHHCGRIHHWINLGVLLNPTFSMKSIAEIEIKVFLNDLVQNKVHPGPAMVIRTVI